VALAVIGRVTLELEGERVVVAPFSVADMRAAQTADEIGALEIFAGHIEEPADAGERGAAWVAAACEVWRAEVEDLMARLKGSANRAARRHAN
jgi:hypothetical protein